MGQVVLHKSQNMNPIIHLPIRERAILAAQLWQPRHLEGVFFGGFRVANAVSMHIYKQFGVFHILYLLRLLRLLRSRDSIYAKMLLTRLENGCQSTTAPYTR